MKIAYIVDDVIDGLDEVVDETAGVEIVTLNSAAIFVERVGDVCVLVSWLLADVGDDETGETIFVDEVVDMGRFDDEVLVNVDVEAILEVEVVLGVVDVVLVLVVVIAVVVAS